MSSAFIFGITSYAISFFDNEDIRHDGAVQDWKKFIKEQTMKESKLRKFHRYFGIILAVFLLLQGGSGLLIAFGQLFDTSAHSEIFKEHHDERQGEHTGVDSYLRDVEDHEDDEKHGILGQVHHKNGTVWHFYRVVVGTGLMAMIFSGMAIFIKIQTRLKNTGRN